MSYTHGDIMSSVREQLHHTVSDRLGATTRTYNGCFPLNFRVRSNAGHSGKDYNLDNLMRHDHSVWSSAIAPPVFILFDSDSPVTVTEMLIKIPKTGYTCPAKDIDIMLFDRPSGEECLMAEPLAKLSITTSIETGYVKHVFSVPISGVLSVLLVGRTVWGETSENVDIQYVTFGGYRGPHAFPSAAFL